MTDATPTMADITGLLQVRRRADPSSPLLTWYGPEGARVDLSATTTANWADKIANFLDDEGVDPGEPLALPLATARPTHWTTLVWVLGAWQWGCPVVLDGPAVMGVVGPGGQVDADTIVECSLHPFGLGGSVEPGRLDFGDVRLQPDVHQRQPWNPAVLAPLPATAPSSQRRLVAPGEPWATVAAALVAPLLGTGSTVLIDSPVDDTRLAQIAATERAVG